LLISHLRAAVVRTKVNKFWGD